MGTITQKLAALFEHLPGIGPRQAKRFVYALLDEKKEVTEALAAAILEFAAHIKRCSQCFRAFESSNDICETCRTQHHAQTLLVVERDIDLENVETTGVYDGLSHILGGTLSPLSIKSSEKLRFKELYARVKTSDTIKEVIIATSATYEGDATATYIERILEEFTKKHKVILTRLGRGLSTGTSLEFSDRATLQNAFTNRKQLPA